MPRSLSSRFAIAALVATAALVWFAGIGTRTLIHPDEGRYAEISREMVATGDWVTPRLNGLKYFEKPPLQYWLGALAFEAFGQGNAAARLPTVASTLIAALFIGFVGWRLSGPALGIAAGAALAGMSGYVVGAHVLALDGLLTATLAIALGAFLMAQRDDATPREELACMLLAWAAMAAATLTKGLIGIVIPGATLVLYTAITRDLGVWRRLHLLAGVALYLALAAPWFIAVSSANPEFARFFFVHEHFERYLSTGHQRVGAWWYFLPLLAFGVLPWVTILACGAARTWRDPARMRNGFSWPRFALIWSAFVLVFFSASSSKLPGYITPVFPALALVTGLIVNRTPVRTLFRLTLPLVALGVLVLVLLLFGRDDILSRIAFRGGITPEVAGFVRWLTLATGMAVGGGIVALVAWSRNGNALRGVIALALSSLASAQLALIGFDAMRTTRSGYDILQAAQTAGGAWLADAPFYQIRMYDQTVPFYLGRTTTVVEFRDELAPGIDAEPGKAIASLDDWAARWNAHSQAYALMPLSELEALASRRVPMRVLARDARRALVSRR